MADRCIPANPDISGIGVRTAIYAQNLLCFAPIVAHLRDGMVSGDEMEGVEGQSIGMLSIAFAILISTIVQAKAMTSTSPITYFHAAIILDLSWMNNTSTFSWFLLYAHHRSKASSTNKVIPATWSGWSKALLSPVNDLVTGKGKGSRDQDEKPADSQKGVDGDSEGGDGERASIHSGGQINNSESGMNNQKRLFPTLSQPLWYLISRAPVLTLGSIHLSLMATIGIWLWSNPPKFGFPISCDPSLVIVGGSVRFSSPALRICSLLMYSLLVVPGVNLLLPFLFFLTLHILYNWSRRHHSWFRRQCRRIAHAIRGCPHTLREFAETLLRFSDNVPRRQRPSPPDEESQIVHNHHPSPSPTQTSPNCIHTAFLDVGLVCLAIINVIFLIDIELTLSRNRQFQSREDDNWGFGQVLALLLLVVPLRDFVTSINDVRRKRWNVQKKFEKNLQNAIRENSLEGHDFENWIDQGADPNTKYEGDVKFVTLLQFSAYKGNKKLVQYLLGKGALPNIEGGDGRTALHAAAGQWHLDIAFMLVGKRGDAVEEVERAIPYIVELLKDSSPDVCSTAVRMLLSLGAHPQRREEIGKAILHIVEGLKDSDKDVRSAAAKGLSSLGAYPELQEEIGKGILHIVEYLKALSWGVRSAAISVLSLLGAYRELQEEIDKAIPHIVECLKDERSNVRGTTVSVLQSLGAYPEFREEIGKAIPRIVERLEDSQSDIRSAAAEGLSSLGAYPKFREEIGKATPRIVECLKDPGKRVRSAAVSVLSSLGAYSEFREEIGKAIPRIVECLKEPGKRVRSAAVSVLSLLGAYPQLHTSIRNVIFILLYLPACHPLNPQANALACLAELLSHPVVRKICFGWGQVRHEGVNRESNRM